MVVEPKHCHLRDIIRSGTRVLFSWAWTGIERCQFFSLLRGLVVDSSVDAVCGNGLHSSFQCGESSPFDGFYLSVLSRYFVMEFFLMCLLGWHIREYCGAIISVCDLMYVSFLV